MRTGVELKSFAAHDGSFHADEVTACALLLLYNLIDENKIHRTRDQSLIDKCEYVCDVGGIYDPKLKLFDHHQKEYIGEMSSAGMVLLYLKDQGLMQPELYDYFNNVLIKEVDAHDIGKVRPNSSTCSFSQIIANFLPIEYSSTFKEMHEAFTDALHFTFGHLSRMQRRYFYTHKSKEKVRKIMLSRKKYLIFDESMPWEDSFFDLEGTSHPALFIVMPTGKHWKLRGIPPDSHNRMKVRLPLPLEWAGLHEEELKKVSKIEGAIFCHKGRFISIWQTKEDALKALKYILEKEGIQYGDDL